MQHISDVIVEARQVGTARAQLHKGRRLVQEMSVINITQNLT